MNDQVIRLYHIINLLPRYPAMTLTIPKLQNKLLDRGYRVGLRTLQRDMNALESVFTGISSSRQSDRSVCWYWTEDAPAQLSKLALKHGFGDKPYESKFKSAKSSNQNIYDEKPIELKSLST